MSPAAAQWLPTCCFAAVQEVRGSSLWHDALAQVLCEGMNANVSICFDQPGQPLLVEPLFNSTPPNVLVRAALLAEMHPACRQSRQNVSCTLWRDAAPNLGERQGCRLQCQARTGQWLTPGK